MAYQQKPAISMQQINGLIVKLKEYAENFENAALNSHINVNAELINVANALYNSNYMADMAINNFKSLGLAFLRLATSGLTLAAHRKLAYLLPRNGRIVLDVSYLGLTHMAVEDGVVSDVLVDLVFEADEFRFMGKRKAPDHIYKPFDTMGDLLLRPSDKGTSGDRGRFLGGYVVYTMPDSRENVFFVTAEEIAVCRDFSDSWKKTDKRDSSPWKNFPWAMIRKTIIKQTILQLPGKCDRISQVIDYMNVNGGEGIVKPAVIPAEIAETQVKNVISSWSETVSSLSSDRSENGESPETAAPVNPVKEEADPDLVVSDLQSPEFLRESREIITGVSKNLTFDSAMKTVKSGAFTEEQKNFLIKHISKTAGNLMLRTIKNVLGSENPRDFTSVHNLIGRMEQGEFSGRSEIYIAEIEDILTRFDETLATCKNDGSFSAAVSFLAGIKYAYLKTYCWNLVMQAQSESESAMSGEMTAQ